ncbi:hypothetical protein LJC58_08180 [Lachnospiraceae bacterium OttesenSCG-928-D06]|nr:hypothetical protein [Lachnospiraceae bacterium OttesenSCG-928-D06]
MNKTIITKNEMFPEDLGRINAMYQDFIAGNYVKYNSFLFRHIFELYTQNTKTALNFDAIDDWMNNFLEFNTILPIVRLEGTTLYAYEYIYTPFSKPAFNEFAFDIVTGCFFGMWKAECIYQEDTGFRFIRLSDENWFEVNRP